LATSFNLENKFFLSSALPGNWQNISRIDLVVGPKMPDIGRTTALTGDDTMVSCTGRVEKVAGPASQLQAFQLFPGCRAARSGFRSVKQWPSFAKF